MMPPKNVFKERQCTATDFKLKCQQKNFNFQGESEEYYVLLLVNFQIKGLYFPFSMEAFNFCSPRVV